MVVGIIGLDPTNGSVTTEFGFLFFLIGAVTLAIAGQLALSVVRQTNAASAANSRDEAELAETTEAPIETLRRRYAEGKLSDEEFQRRLDRLLEAEELAEAPTDRERVLE
ncbi:SHOCT domain-containing protein [Haloarcula sp. CBA1129]|nr:SHOCT domain-containing protein [Haloarcula sp. CBA1129]